VTAAVAAHERTASARSAIGWTALFAAALIAGIGLRMWQLDAQVIVDDEWHALHKLLRADWKSVFTRFGFADHSIPLTLYYKWVYETFGLSERKMHVPMLVAGIALTAVAPRLARTWATWPTRATWAGLLAISPLLVYHSRVAALQPSTVIVLAGLNDLYYAVDWTPESSANTSQ